MTTTPETIWADYTAAHPEFAELPIPPLEQFGYSPEMCDERLQLVLDGAKRTTADLLVDYGESDRGLPAPGDHWLALDGQGAPQVVLRTMTTRIGQLGSADEEFAQDYAEGDRTVQGWIDEHRERFSDYLPPDTEGVDREPIVFERFAVVWPEAAVTDADRAWLAEIERVYRR